MDNGNLANIGAVLSIVGAITLIGAISIPDVSNKGEELKNKLAKVALIISVVGLFCIAPKLIKK